MIFGDEPREFLESKKKIYGLAPQTSAHVGPGSYFVESDNKSMSPKKGFSSREPMSPASRKTDRNYLYSAGVLTNLGIAHPGSPVTHSSPGPGHYNAGVSQFSPRPASGERKRSDSSVISSAMGTSPRIARANSIIKNGVLFESGASNTKNSPFGPGHYFVEQDSLNKKSFNVRAQSGRFNTGYESQNLSPRMSPRMHARSAGNSPQSYKSAFSPNNMLNQSPRQTPYVDGSGGNDRLHPSDLGSGL